MYPDTDSMTAQELENKRTKHGKVYSFGGNRFEAVTYSEPVHRMNQETGKWEDIDATFHPVKQPDGKTVVLEAKAAELSIACGTSGNTPFVTLTDTKGRTISWGIEGASAAEPKPIERPDAPEAVTVREKREKVMERLHHKLIYTNIFPGVNMICQSGNLFKDEFVFAEPDSSQSIVYRIESHGLLLKEMGDNQVAVTEASGEPVFYFLAPSVMDAERKEGKVSVKLEAVNEGYFDTKRKNKLIFSLDVSDKIINVEKQSFADFLHGLNEQYNTVGRLFIEYLKQDGAMEKVKSLYEQFFGSCQ